MPDGRSMPWAADWPANEFAAWLRARAAWRDTHAEPLPSLWAKERCAMQRLDLPAALVDAERRASHRTVAQLREDMREGYDPRQVLREE